MSSADGSVRWRQRWRHSLKLRLITVFIVLAVAMTGVFLMGMKRAFSGGWRDAARPLVLDYVDRLAAEIGSPPDIAKAEAMEARIPIAVRIEGPRVNWQSQPSDANRPWRSSEHRRHQLEDWLTRTTADGHRVSFDLASTPWQYGGPRGMGWVTLALLLLLVWPAYAYVRRLLKPLDDIRLGAERFGSGRFDEPIPLRRKDELGQLAGRINTMARDIEAMLNAKRGLLLALSHELRSPLTRARLNAELLPSSSDGNAPGDAERAALLRDLGEMRDLISDLLETERLASRHAALNREPSDLGVLVQEAIADLPQAASIRIEAAPALPPVAVDRTRLRLLVRNAADNALRYSAGAPQSPVISLKPEAGGVRLDIRDFGPGVEAAQLAQLTEPFYRTDGARQRATGGVGLGMYLCRLVAEAHGSTLDVRNAEPGLGVSLLLK